MPGRLPPTSRRLVAVVAAVAVIAIAAACGSDHHAAAPVTTTSTTMSSISLPTSSTTNTTTAASSSGAACRAPGAPYAPAPVVRASGPLLVSRNLAYGPTNDEDLDVYQPRASKPLPAVLLVHGGGWMKGDKLDLKTLATTLAGAGFVVFDANYTLATASNAGYPNQLDQLETAVSWIRSHASNYGVDPARVGALGASAGGNLVALLGLVPTGPCTSGARVAAVVSWSGPMDLTALYQHPCVSARKCEGINRVGIGDFAGCPTPTSCPAKYQAASPASHVGGDDPPIYLFNSSDEVIPEDQAANMATSLAGKGVTHQLTVYPGTKHARAYTQLALAPSVAFLHKWLG